MQLALSGLPDVAEASRGPDGWENWRAFERDDAGAGEIIEFSYYTDSHLTGEIHEGLGPYELLNTVPAGPIPPQPGAVEHALVIRVAVHDAYENQYQRPGRHDDPESGWRKPNIGSYHGGGIGDELGALLALALGIRLRCGGITRSFGGWTADDPLGRPVEYAHEVPSIVKPARNRPPVLPLIARPSVNLDQSVPLMRAYPTLGIEDAVALVRAARQYEQGVWVCDADAGISWLALVSAVEIAAERWRGYKKGTVVDRFRANAPDIAAIVEPAGQEIVLGLAKALAPQLKSGDRFRKFLTTFAPNPPEPRPIHAALEWANLDAALREIYARRSEALHAGVPIPHVMLMAPRPSDNGGYEETIGAIGVWSGSNYWPSTSVPMNLHTFEYIVRHALLAWWRQMATPTNAAR